MNKYLFLIFTFCVSPTVISYLTGWTLITSASSSESVEKVLPPIISLLLDEENCTGDIEDLLSMEHGDKLSVVCDYDLGAAEVILPPSVVLEDQGGSIKNGQLIFGASSKIDGGLLNYKLTVLGNVSLLNQRFIFDKNKWGIVEGLIDLATSSRNKARMQKAIDVSKSLGATVFSMSEIDAYFDTNWLGGRPRIDHLKAIQLPSDFHFELSDDTRLRMQPSHLPWGALIMVMEKSNVQITGGHLYGERFEHDYSPISDFFNRQRDTHEWPALVIVGGSKNVVIDSIHTYDSTGDGVVFGAAVGGHRTDPSKPFNENVRIKNSTISRSRRNGMSITDGKNLQVLNCVFTETGLGERGNTIISSSGVDPRFAIDIEPFVGYEPDTGAPIYFEKVENVLIEGNTFTKSGAGSVIDYSGINVTFKDNHSDHIMSVNNGTGTKFIGNTIIADQDSNVFVGISTGSRVAVIDGQNIEFSKDFEVRNNTINGASRGISIVGAGGIVEDNLIESFSDRGISLGGATSRLENFTFSGNVIRNPLTSFARGIQNNAGVSMTNLVFENTTISVPRFPISLADMNTGPADAMNSVVFKDSSFSSTESGLWPTSIRRTGGEVEFRNNDFFGTELVVEDANVVTDGNRFEN